MSVAIHPLQGLELADLVRIASGYVSTEKLRVHLHETVGGGIRFELEPTLVDPPYIKTFVHSAADIDRIQGALSGGTSWGAWDSGVLIGVAVTERMAWNRNLTLWEFHVAAGHRRQGVGRSLMEKVMEGAGRADVRSVTAETQNTNMPAIRFYRGNGFLIQGVDVSLYADDRGVDQRETALYMRRML